MAQLVEQRIRNAQGIGSSPITSSKASISEAFILCGFLAFLIFEIEKNQDRKIINFQPKILTENINLIPNSSG